MIKTNSYPSSHEEPITNVEARLEKLILDMHSFNNSLNNLKQVMVEVMVEVMVQVMVQVMVEDLKVENRQS